VRASRRAKSALSMRDVVDGIKEFPHSEEAGSGCLGAPETGKE